MLQTAWSGYYADRALLLFSLVWLVGRGIKRASFAGRPAELYEPLTWLGALAFPEPVSTTTWTAIAALTALAVVACLWRPRLIAGRLAIAIGVLLLMASEFAYGKIEHVNHLFLLAHVYALFLPIARPDRWGPGEGSVYTSAPASLETQAKATMWYQGGLLFVYTMSGLWKFADMTIVAWLKPRLSWLHPESMPALSALSYHIHDFSLAVPEAFYAVRWVFPVGYVLMAFLLASAALAAVRRPLIALVLPTIVVFHLMNALTLYALFLSTIVVAILLFFPYGRWSPAAQRQYVSIAQTRFSGTGRSASYERHYENGDTDVFEGFYAYRARLEDRSWFLAAPLYYPGVVSVSSWFLRRRSG